MENKRINFWDEAAPITNWEVPVWDPIERHQEVTDFNQQYQQQPPEIPDNNERFVVAVYDTQEDKLVFMKRYQTFHWGHERRTHPIYTIGHTEPQEIVAGRPVLNLTAE